MKYNEIKEAGYYWVTVPTNQPVIMRVKVHYDSLSGLTDRHAYEFGDDSPWYIGDESDPEHYSDWNFEGPINPPEGMK